MTHFAATFANGKTITRTSDHAYTFAWGITSVDGTSIGKTGFSADRENAAKAAEAILPRGVSARDRKNPALRRLWAKMAKEKGFANADALIAHWDADAADRRAALRIEIVPARIAA